MDVLKVFSVGMSVCVFLGASVVIFGFVSGGIVGLGESVGMYVGFSVGMSVGSIEGGTVYTSMGV